MKQKIYILGLVTALIINIGAILKVNHWPGAAILLILGILMLALVFIPFALLNNYKAERNRQNLILYWATGVTCIVVFIAMLFKILHWPYAGIALLIALPFPYVVFLPVFLSVTGKNKNFNIYNTVFVLFLLTAVSAVSLLLALSVSGEKAADTLALAGNYNRMEIALNALPSDNKQSSVNQKIDDLLKISGEYKDIILSIDKVTADQWNSDPNVLMVSDSWQRSNNQIMDKGQSEQIKLLEGLSDFIKFLEETPDHENLAKAAPAIFDMHRTPGGSYMWNSDIIISSVQPWSLVYLEGLETNLKLIKATVIN